MHNFIAIIRKHINIRELALDLLLVAAYYALDAKFSPGGRSFIFRFSEPAMVVTILCICVVVPSRITALFSGLADRAGEKADALFYGGYITAMLTVISAGVYIPILMYQKHLIHGNAGMALVLGAIGCFFLVIRFGAGARDRKPVAFYARHMEPALSVLCVVLYHDLAVAVLADAGSPAWKLFLYAFSGLLPMRILGAMEPPVRPVNAIFGFAALAYSLYWFMAR